MLRKITEFQTLTGENPKANPRLTALQVELAQLEDEIGKLLDTLIGANATLLAYANTKIEELDGRRQKLTKAIADMTSGILSVKQIEQIAVNLDNWETLPFDDRRVVTDGLITRIDATSERVEIAWRH